MLAFAIAIVQIAAGYGDIKDKEALRNDMPKETQNFKFVESWLSQPVRLFRLIKLILPIDLRGATPVII